MLPPDGTRHAAELASCLRSVSRRLQLADLLKTTAVGGVAAAAIYAVGGRAGLSVGAAAALALAVTGVISGLWLKTRVRHWSGAAAACAIERAEPDSRNLIVTAEELLRHPDRARPGVLLRVFEQGLHVARSRRNAAVPLHRVLLQATGAMTIAAALVLGVPQRGAVTLQQTLNRAGSEPGRTLRDLQVMATITPPAYTGESARTLENPDRIEATEGSVLRLALESEAGWHARFGADALPAATAGGARIAVMTLTRSGYLAFESSGPDQAASRRLVPVTVTPDRAPAIRIEAPAKDLLLPDAKPTVPVTASATDDFGLESLALRYTKISGSGEQFEFQEGTLPLVIARETGRSWRARADIGLASLQLGPGDSVVYRIVGRDRRPGTAGIATSDTFFIEIAGPGQVALAGFELPPDRERYALSQQMIVLKLERLKAREASMERPALLEEVAGIAAEQRAVKANFVFLTGGHVEDEEEEAEQSHEIQEGRLENTARREIALAIQFMTRTEQALAQVRTSMALPPARSAVEALQRAFGRNRYFLRTLPVRSRVDPARRLTGELASASDWRRELFPTTPDDDVASARQLFSRLLELAPQIRAGSAPPAALTAFAEQALATDAASPEWQAISRGFLEIRDTPRASEADRSTLAAGIAGALGRVIQREALTARPVEAASAALRSAWAEERRR